MHCWEGGEGVHEKEGGGEMFPFQFLHHHIITRAVASTLIITNPTFSHA